MPDPYEAASSRGRREYRPRDFCESNLMRPLPEAFAKLAFLPVIAQWFFVRLVCSEGSGAGIDMASAIFGAICSRMA